jgi:ABC-type dipeptide/oligopeptide/nickel transport system permease component
MRRYLFRRVLLAAATVLVSTFAAFLALRIVPGDTLSVIAAERLFDPRLVAAWRAQYGLDQPVLVQYFVYVRNLLSGDLGVSHYSGRPVAEMLGPALAMTLQWQIPALLLAVVGAVALALATADARRRVANAGVVFLLLIGISLPEFVTATVLVSVFSLRLNLLPVAGVADPVHFVLPVITMAVYQCAALSRVLRGELRSAMHERYTLAARARGISRWDVLTRHALPNAIGPFMTLAGIQLGRAIGGAFLIETIFNIPGVGRVAVQAVLQRDYPVILAVTTVVVAAFALVSLVVDWLYALVDKRVSVAS